MDRYVWGEDASLKATHYFRLTIQGKKRPEMTDAICEYVMASAEKIERQPDGRFRYFRAVPALGGRIVRVVTLEDGESVHNAFPDRRAKR
jgi:hypothetical protein